MLGDQEQTDALVAALTRLRAALADLRLPLDLPGAGARRDELRALREHLDDYLLPRVRQAGAPLLAVVGGSTGAGKSTLVNSVLRSRVSDAGVLRPTTRSPVLVHHPDDAAWFTSDRVLPGLARVTGPGGRDGGARALRLVGHDRVPRGLALLDAPDIDSVVTENRELGAELLGAADLWVFVTTAARYADAVPWDLLAAAARRRAVVGLVLNRVDPPSRDAVADDLARMLTENGLEHARLLTVPEGRPVDDVLPPAAVDELLDWLTGIAGDAVRRRSVVERSVRGALDDVVRHGPELASAADEQAAHGDRLRAVVERAYDDAARDVATATSDGTMLRGEVLARWQEFVGTGELLRAIEQRVGGLRDRLTAVIRGHRPPEIVTAAVGSGLVELVRDAADGAADRAYAGWQADPAGRHLLDDLRLSRASSDLRIRVEAEVRAWQSAVLDLVATEGADRRATARFLSFGVNGLGAALMVAIFASTGGLTAAEVGVAGGTAVLAQRLLEAVFGDDAVRRLTRTAHEDLTRRVERLLHAEAGRFATVLEALDLRPRSGDVVRAAAQDVEEAARWLRPAGPTEPPWTTGSGGPTALRGSGRDGVGTVPAGRPANRADRPADQPAVVRWWRRLWHG